MPDDPQLEPDASSSTSRVPTPVGFTPVRWSIADAQEFLKNLQEAVDFQREHPEETDAVILMRLDTAMKFAKMVSSGLLSVTCSTSRGPLVEFLLAHPEEDDS